ncbi:MAG: ankyrin repeat domain-containing protein [SAR324 cluster bacterium]|nr:ankyrin repeat domain-containing protein [SAR324 cluster bacterium]
MLLENACVYGKGPGDQTIDKTGTTRLMAAAYGNNPTLVNQYIKAGAKLDLQDKDGWTALMYAAQEGHAEMVKLLLDKGADAKIKTKQGFTALDIARNRQHQSIIDLLSPPPVVAAPSTPVSPQTSLAQPMEFPQTTEAPCIPEEIERLRQSGMKITQIARHCGFTPDSSRSAADAVRGTPVASTETFSTPVTNPSKTASTETFSTPVTSPLENEAVPDEPRPSSRVTSTYSRHRLSVGLGLVKGGYEDANISSPGWFDASGTGWAMELLNYEYFFNPHWNVGIQWAKSFTVFQSFGSYSIEFSESIRAVSLGYGWYQGRMLINPRFVFGLGTSSLRIKNSGGSTLAKYEGDAALNGIELPVYFEGNSVLHTGLEIGLYESGTNFESGNTTGKARVRLAVLFLIGAHF